MDAIDMLGHFYGNCLSQIFESYRTENETVKQMIINASKSNSFEDLIKVTYNISLIHYIMETQRYAIIRSCINTSLIFMFGIAMIYAFAKTFERMLA